MTRWTAVIGRLPVVAVLVSMAMLLPGNGPQPVAAGAAPVSAPLSAVPAPPPGGVGNTGNGGGPVQAGDGATPSSPQGLLASGVPTPSRPPRPVSYPTGSPGSTGPCPTGLAPQVLVYCGAAPNAPTEFKFYVTADRDMVIVQVASTQYGLVPRLFGPDGEQVTCDIKPESYTFGPVRCVTGKAGTYTLRLVNPGSWVLPIALSYLPVFSTDKCVAMRGKDSSLGDPTVYSGTVPSGMAGDCWTTDFATGDVVRQLGSNLSQSVFDATGRDVCAPGSPQVSGPDCRLAGTAPYRLVVQYGYESTTPGEPSTHAYKMAMSRLSRPEGCAVVEPQTYGVAPDLTDTTRCRILRVPADGHYMFRGTRESGPTGGTLYRSDLSTLCPSGDCDLTAGDYLFTPPPSTSATPYGMVLRSATETRGCTAGRDDQMASGAPVENFGSAGHDLCRTLPTASGRAVYVLNGTANGGTARYRVLDATGAEQCHGFTVNDTYQVCRLTGTAPFRLVADAQGPFDYRLLVQRVDETAGCTPWGAAEYGTGSGLRTGLSGKPADGALESCFAVPADHPATELVGFRLPGTQVGAALHLVGPSGEEFCQVVVGGEGTCRPPVGKAYTAVLTYGRALGDYTLVRRDATPSAACDLPAATGQVGGPSTGFTFDSTVDAHCTAFDAAATDLLQASTHTNTSQVSAGVTVLDADGRTLCSGWGADCRVTGSTRYLAVVAAPDPLGRAAAPGGLDVWRLATAAGWAPECAAHPVSADGFDQRSGVLTSDAPLYCAVLEMRPGQKVDVASVTDDYSTWARLTVAGRENWADGDTAYKCTQDSAVTGLNTVCTYSGTTTGHAVLLFSPGHAHLPLPYTLQGARPGTGTARSGLPESVTPAELHFGGSPEVTVHGTGLSLNTQMQLSVGDFPGWCTVLRWRPLRVNADGTELVIQVDLASGCVGTYDLVIQGAPYQRGVPSPGYLPKALKVIA
ncbi:hypothetical protein ACIHEI_13750 [Kitasatospora sp. NPDC051984]|uniref:hypothetical protein n=1 Tax=Kitasatospora sp. NPDC051984 TaxID=3364059 RepID=UPI0037C9C06B